MTYSKEPGEKTDQRGKFSLGQNVKLNNFSRTNYPFWKAKDEVGEIIGIHTKTVPAVAFRDDREVMRMFSEYYGLQEKYDIVGLYIKFSDGVHLMSPFGVETL